MAYFQNNGMGGYPQYMSPQSVMNMYSPMPTNTVVKVHGREGANAFNMGPNGSALLLDDSEPIVWFKQTDGAGYPTVTGYRITPLESTDTSITGIQNAISSLATRLDKLEKELGVNVESNS